MYEEVHGEICKVYDIKDDYDGKEGEDDLINLHNLLIQWVTTTPNSVMGKQAWEVQGRGMYATRLWT